MDTLLKNVCVAKQHAKQAGKNSFRVFDATMSDAESRTTQITRGFGEALTRHQFSLVFQPKFDGRGNRVTGAEALIRWTHPVLGNIPPMDFIPLAEETGQIVPISEWVIGEVCRQMNVWRKEGLPPVKVAINLSPEQLRLSGYAERVSAMVREAGHRHAMDHVRDHRDGGDAGAEAGDGGHRRVPDRGLRLRHRRLRHGVLEHGVPAAVPCEGS